MIILSWTVYVIDIYSNCWLRVIYHNKRIISAWNMNDSFIVDASCDHLLVY